MSNVSFQQADGVELLSLVFQMIVACILRLFEYYEFVTLQIDLTLMTESKFKCLILEILYLVVWSSLPLLFNDITLQVSKLLETFLSAFYHQVSRLLQGHVMLALCMLDVIDF